MEPKGPTMESKPQNKNQPRGWHSRGYLPHFDGGEILQFITLRLGDAVPLNVIQKWERELEREEPSEAMKRLYWKIEKYIDCGYGKCFLGIDEIALMVETSLLHFDGERYKLSAWVVMPNHIHYLFRPMAGNPLSDLMKNFKSYTSHKANKLLRRSGQFWQEDYFDRYIRNYEHYEKTIDYIEMNPVKAGLCEKPSDWRYSSAYHRKMRQ
jgi:REP element-mobilizing transposase RayT